MYRSLTLVLIILVNTTLKSQTYSSLIPDKEIEEFVSWKLKDTMQLLYIPNDYSRRIFPLKIEMFDSSKKGGFCIYQKSAKWIDSIFSKEDKAFFFDQFKNIKTNTWPEKDGLPKGKETEKGYGTFISIPIFSQNRQFVIVYVYHFCGQNCGRFSIPIYKKTEGTWKFYRQIIGAVF